MLQNTDCSSLKKKKSNIYMYCNNKLRTYSLIKSEYRMEASIVDHTNGKMLTKLRLLHLFYFIYFVYLFYSFIYLLLGGGTTQYFFS